MPANEGQAAPDSTATGTVQCPWCWAVWSWLHPIDQNYAADEMLGACPRCGREVDGLPACVRQLYRAPDLPGYPSE